MSNTLKQRFTIAHFSAMEHLGTPAVLLMTLTAVVGTLLLPLFQFQHFSEDGRLARDCGFATAFLFGFFLVIGCTAKIYRSLHDGTAAIALSKPLTRGCWFCGQLCGIGFVLIWFLVTMGAAVVTAEACSPRYHAAGAYADLLSPLLLTLLFPIAALLIGAFVHRRHGRFTLTAALALPPLLWYAPFLTPPPHWGSLTLLPPIACFLAQVLTFAGALATRLSPGFTLGLTLLTTAFAFYFGNASAYLPFDLLAHGGAVPASLLLLLLPQTLLCTFTFGGCGIYSLSKKDAI